MEVWFLLVILSVIELSVGQPKLSTVTTPLGTLMGIQEPHDQQNVHKFLKIPYAKPPVGELRLKKPQPIEPWSNIYDATKHGPSCVQKLSESTKAVLENKNISEDCLFLNVYAYGELSPSANKSVMVWFHGGAYTVGQATLYDGTFLALTGDVIVVTVNYRLGILGYFSTGDSVSMGNYGLWDKIEALKWVQRNIRSFGGNPNSVTIFGESAGGFSVSILSVIPENSGLFNRVIMQSGVFTSPYAILENPNSKAVAFCFLSKCEDIITSQGMYDCVRNMTVDEILQHQHRWESSGLARSLFGISIGPVIDGDLIKVHPEESVRNTSSDAYMFYRSLDIMAGCTSEEGALAAIYIFPIFQKALGFNVSKGTPTSLLSTYFAMEASENMFNGHSKVKQAIVDKFGSSNMEVQARKIMDLYGDIFFYVPMVQAIDIHTNGNNLSNTFQFLFSEKSPIRIYGKDFSWMRGAEHGAELIPLFGGYHNEPLLKSLGVNITSEQKTLAEQMAMYWTNFARNGNPNLGQEVQLKWPEYNTENKTYIDLAVPTSVEKALYEDRFDFWTKHLPLIAESDTTGTGVTLVTNKLIYFIVFCLIFFIRGM